MFGDANSSALQEEVLDLTDRIYNSWITWVNIMKILKHYFIFLQFADYIHRPQYYSNFMVHQGSLRATKGTSLGIVMQATLQHC